MGSAATPVEGSAVRGVVSDRNAIFISHANPEDNDFTLWLGAKLSALGYEVWADILKLRGGQDWERRLEGALRRQAFKVLFVGSAVAVEKQGVRNELRIASDTARQISDDSFIIPLRLEAYAPPFTIVQAQYVDFSKGWRRGLADLLETLDSYQVPKANGIPPEVWREAQLREGDELLAVPEQLVSDWLEISQQPARLRFYDFRAGIQTWQTPGLIRSCPSPAIPYQRGFLSFADSEELAVHFGENFPLITPAEIDTAVFVKTGWPARGITSYDARRHIVDLFRQGLERWLSQRGLRPLQRAGGKTVWWMPKTDATVRRRPFHWTEDLYGSRQLVGSSERLGLHWHYAVSVLPRLWPVPHVQIPASVAFSRDGISVIDDVGQAHRTRRSFTKNWRNAKWRDLLLAFLAYMAEDKAVIRVPMGGGQVLQIAVPPLSLSSPVSGRAESPAEGDSVDGEGSAERELLEDPEDIEDDVFADGDVEDDYEGAS